MNTTVPFITPIRLEHFHGKIYAGVNEMSEFILAETEFNKDNIAWGIVFLLETPAGFHDTCVTDRLQIMREKQKVCKN